MPPLPYRMRQRPGFCSHQLSYLVVVATQVNANQGCDQARKVVPVHQPQQICHFSAKAEAARRLQGLGVRKGKELVPGDLDLAEEYVDADLAKTFALFEQAAFVGRIATGPFAQSAQVAPVLSEKHLRRVAEHARRAFIVARVASPVQNVNPVFPATVGHLPRCRPACLSQRFRGAQRRLAPDSCAQEYGCDEHAKQRGWRITREIQTELTGECPAMAAEEELNQPTIAPTAAHWSRCAQEVAKLSSAPASPSVTAAIRG